MECPFCKINLSRTKILKEGKSARVIFSNPRLMPYHILIVPKRHIEKISELTKEELNEIIDLIIKFEEKILSRISKGCDIRQNYRPFQQQNSLKVNHIHFHLQPRELYDELYKKCQINEVDIFKVVDLKDLDESKFS
jgi:diadenosine tetraphosphate (Ap4A) HIT family hydrolase